MTKNNKRLMLFYPDSLWTPEMISGAAFLYFKEPIVFTIPSASSIGMLGVAPSRLFDLVKERAPKWAEEFQIMYKLYVDGSILSSKTMELLKPLHGPFFKWIQLVYPHTTEWLDEAEDLQKSMRYQESSIIKMINLFSAGDSLAKHILFEMYIQTINSGKRNEDSFNIDREYGRNLNSVDPTPPEEYIDITPLYDYCDELFSKQSLNKLLCKSYMLRLVALRKIEKVDTIFVSNTEIIPLLSSMPIETDDDRMQSPTAEANEDIIAWEIFRQILSPTIDPLDEKRIELILKFRSERNDEVSRFRNKCNKIAYELHKIPSMENLENEISSLIEREVRNEIRDLLQLDRRSMNDFMTSVFSDEKTWLAIAALIGAIFAGHEIFKAGAAIAALSNLGAKAFKAASDRKKILRTSDYTILYNINRKLGKA